MSDEVTNQETPVEEPIKEETTKKMVFHLDIDLPSTGEPVRVFKLKAGKYYEAQKMYVEWIRELQKVVGQDTASLQDAVDENGVVDPEKLKKSLDSKAGPKFSDILGAVDSASEKRMSLLAICLSMGIKELEETYYPEDLDMLLEKIIELNNFLDNVKKSVAPIGGKGAMS